MGSMDLGTDYCYARVGAPGSVLIDHLHQGWLAGVSVVFAGCCPPDAFREKRGGRAFRSGGRCRVPGTEGTLATSYKS